MKSKLVLLLGSAVLLSLTAFAQDEYPEFEVPVGFSFVNVHPQVANISSFNIFGGGGGFVYNFTPLMGLKADVDGYTQGSGQQITQNGKVVGSASGNLLTYLFGLQFKKHDGKFQPFAEALWGGAHTNLYANICKLGSVCGSSSGSNNGGSMEYGLGLDIPITSSIQIRPVEVDYLYTHFGSNHIAGAATSQNSFKYFAGINFTFGSGNCGWC